jgi:phage shock protein E
MDERELKMIKNKLSVMPIILVLIIFISFFIVGGCKTDQEVGKGSGVTEETIEEIEEESKEESAVDTEEETFTGEEEAVIEVIPISVEEVYEIIKNNQDYIILDVRTKEEFNEGHLEDAILIPVSELESRLDELPKDKPIIVYCRSGVRSRNAANMLVENGFIQIYDMGGILDWQEEGYPVEVGE